LPKKKSESEPKKKTKSPKLGLLDHFLVLLEQFLYYFELLLIYLRKKLNQSLRQVVIILLFLSYGFFLLFASTGFFLHASYIMLLNLYEGNVVHTSLTIGIGLCLLSLSILYFLIKKILI